jgi:hypothetical protein
MLLEAKATFSTETNDNAPTRRWKVDANLSVVRVSRNKQKE